MTFIKIVLPKSISEVVIIINDICLAVTIMMIKECVEPLTQINSVNKLTFLHCAFSSESSLKPPACEDA